MASQALLQIWLTAAESSYNDLMTGKAPRVIVDQNGERIEYTPANAARLAAYILDLQKQLGIANGRIAGPMRVFL